MTFAAVQPTIMDRFIGLAGEAANGAVGAAPYPAWDEDKPAVELAVELQNRYRPGETIRDGMYFEGLAEVTIQVEAIKMALEKVPAEELKPADVLEYGFYQMEDFDIGGIGDTTITFGPDKCLGYNVVRVDQVQSGKQVKLGTWPAQYLLGIE